MGLAHLGKQGQMNPIRSSANQKAMSFSGEAIARAPGVEGHALRQARAALSNAAGTVAG
jgi:hypothetical protein